MAPAAILFQRLARREYDEAVRWYARRNAQAARGFENEANRALQLISANPNGWPVYQGSDHFFRLRRYSYVLYYRIVDPTRVLIMAVAHISRRPGYWRRRRWP
jgi:plasmid stabilization system protein ParE